MRKAGFTLVEMLVVIGIIAVLLGVVAVGMGGMVRRSQRARTQEIVSNAATALTLIFNEDKAWPKPLVDGLSQHRLTRDVCNAFVRHGDGLLGISYKKETGEDGVTRRVVDSQGAERFGLLTPVAADYVRKHANASTSSKVPGGGTIDDHVIWYSIDVDGDGLTEVPTDNGNVKVRATACAWLPVISGTKERYMVQSWQSNQEKN